MKLFKIVVSIVAVSLVSVGYAQETKIASETKVDKQSYYQNRAYEDAKYEQQFVAETKAEEEAFWKEQQAYEKDLKRQDKKAHKAYVKGKKDAYKSHYSHCDSHCHHSASYYGHASFYYYGYHEHYNQRYPRRSSSVSAGVRVATPNVRVGLF
ncbi:hypothetical protein [Mariniflexile sp. AS56]|uniref:hypothetical protein n=1 Tax=Mariniflexile sp. AS56 TaxID=3063957 RepID=UPI0026ED67D6|nr:hypothetical protein [Mariniflexile sp. AS56]MDO7172679.1 hypothetical protein [Mariniflexile sp. AS56]